MTVNLSLNETELLLLQQEMEGNVSGVGYKLNIAGVETAEYRGLENQDIFDTEPVRASDRSGWIRKIKFYVQDPRNGRSNTTVLLSVFNDGHIRCDRFVPPELADNIVDEIVRIKQYKSYLTPLNELLAEFVDRTYRGRPHLRDEFISDVNTEFENVIDEYYDTTNFSEQEDRLHISLLANIGIAISENGVPSASSVPDVNQISSSSLSVEDGNIEDFFSEHAYEVNNVQNLDYSELVNHLEHLLTQPWNQRPAQTSTPLEMLEYAIEHYDLTV